MKNIKFMPGLLLVMAVFLSACTKMNDYEKYLKNGAITYPGKVDSVTVHSGNERVRLSMTLASDPSVSKVRAFWNNHADSAEVDVVRTGGINTANMLIKNLDEGTYNFELYTYDNLGHSSVASNVSATVYGAVYEGALPDRPLISATCGKIKWGDSTTEMIGVEVTYADNSNAQKHLFVPNSELETVLPNLGKELKFEYRTLYVPDSLAIDTFYSAIKPGQIANNILSGGTYTVLSNTIDWPISGAGQTVTVTQLSDTKFSFLIAATENNRTQIIVNINPTTKVTSVALQEIGDFGERYRMTAESIEDADNYVSPCEGIISVRLHIDDLMKDNTWGNHTIALKKNN